MRTSLILLLLSGCSWLEDSPEEPVPTTVVTQPAETEPTNECVQEQRDDLLRVATASSGPAVTVPFAEDWQVDCTRSVDPDGSAQLLSASSESQRSSAYILSLSGPVDADADEMLQTALTEMRQVWEMSGVVGVDRPFPSRPIAVLNATDNDSGEMTWQVVTVSKSPNGDWLRIHQTWNCGDCGLDAMGTKYVIDAMVGAAMDWGFPG